VLRDGDGYALLERYCRGELDEPITVVSSRATAVTNMFTSKTTVFEEKE
jgi:hypothetical protein